MSAEFVRREEFETLADQMTGYTDVAVQKYVRESERRIRAEMQAFRAEVRQELQAFREELQAFRERHDVEMAQVHTEIAQIHEVLMWMAQRLPQEPISPPPAQFLKHDGEHV